MDLDKKRKQIDIIDDKIAALFNERMQIVKEIGVEKAKSGAAILNLNRENEIITRITGLVNSEISPYAKKLFETLFELSRDYQTK
jgi:monofunctional chorismate mutase